MELNLNYYVLRKIFKLLNGFDLHNASQVCSSWFEAANDVKNERGPMYVIKRRKKTLLNNKLEQFEKEVIECSQVKPSLIMLLYVPFNKAILERCYCDFIPVKCYLLSLEYHSTIRRMIRPKKTVACMFFPEVPDIRYSTFTLKKNLKRSEIYCEELKLFIDNSFQNSDKLKTTFEEFFINDSTTTSCLILLCNNINNNIAIDLVKSLKEWFPNKNFPLWGGMVDRISVCTYEQNTRSCKVHADSIAILIGGPEMKIWSVILDHFCETEKVIDDTLKTFKESITLKKHSIGFIFSSRCRENYLLALDSSIYHNHFPNIPLVNCVGHKSLGSSLDEAYKKISHDWNEIGDATLMIITYN
ncbi:PREDICTED: uncharacterized protein LOC107068272 [Polistes dominula]|uniref:Uncharacterized protein LOC107068272 n=1 Tax=Polistes dominula TaxID=743375 RepID=A0ABM1IIE2_POLDO|nr:PREDICTED: uncharacterized protein LOC107068272 [Polistes dominula]